MLVMLSANSRQRHFPSKSAAHLAHTGTVAPDCPATGRPQRGSISRTSAAGRMRQARRGPARGAGHAPPCSGRSLRPVSQSVTCNLRPFRINTKLTIVTGCPSHDSQCVRLSAVVLLALPPPPSRGRLQFSADRKAASTPPAPNVEIRARAGGRPCGAPARGCGRPGLRLEPRSSTRRSSTCVARAA
jgi:hypothetical protein